jgi:uncharacterized RDD family membrane protein YckC
MLDTAHSIETPEGVELELRVAGPVVRALAWAIDFGIRSALYLGLFYFLSHLEKLGLGILLICVFVIEWFYPVFFEIYRQGATPGKKTMKIKVLHELGTPVNWSASMIRNLLRAIDFLPFLYGFGFITMLLSTDFKRMGDLAAGTVVVYQDEAVKYLALPEEPPLFISAPLTSEEQRAIISFAERAQTLSPARAIELANLVTPLTGNTGEAAVKTLYQIANGLIGRSNG